MLKILLFRIRMSLYYAHALFSQLFLVQKTSPFGYSQYLTALLEYIG